MTMIGGKDPEQTVHSIEEVGFVHHIWDEIGPELTTGVCVIVVALIAYWGKKKYDERH